MLAEFGSTADPEQALSDSLAATITGFLETVKGIPPARLIEAARLACLTFAPVGGFIPNPEAAPARAELLALLAIAGDSAGNTGLDAHSDGLHVGTSIQPLTDLVHGRLLDIIDRILNLSLVRDLFTTDRSDPLAYISWAMRGTQVWIRNSSYADMVQDLYTELLGEQGVQRALQALLGFDCELALRVLTTCHEIQVEGLNRRFDALRLATTVAMSSEGLDSRAEEAARQAWTTAWEPVAEQIVVEPEEIATIAELPVETVQTVLDFFSVDVQPGTAHEVAAEFARGANRMRIRPVLALHGGYMLIHDGDLMPAIRERFEYCLKSSASWEQYAKHRGELLERRTRNAFARILPRADCYEGFEYYVPNSSEEAAGPPSGYTKRVEGDHLIIQDDVAFVVEDKAVALSPTSREGETQRLRRDLSGIITKAAEQAGRLSRRIREDSGIVVHRKGWVDLSRIREIHTIAVSLEDLAAVSTATAQLVLAGIIDPTDIPWTVSILDLELIARLVDHPSEFLLYLRRRRAVESTIVFTAPDELDLFLHFLTSGLYVEPDPTALRRTFPWMGDVRTAERRRYEAQQPTYITSHTDPLDRWHYDQLTGGRSAPKPSMGESPIRPLIEQLMNRGDYAWLSIGATLLANSFASQAQMAKIPRDLLRNPFGDGRRRSQAIPAPQSADPADSWLLVWMTSPKGRAAHEWEQEARDYLRAKKHQLGLARGVAFDYSEQTGDLVGVYFDDYLGPLDDRLASIVRTLRPPEALSRNVPPSAKRRPGSRGRSRG